MKEEFIEVKINEILNQNVNTLIAIKGVSYSNISDHLLSSFIDSYLFDNKKINEEKFFNRDLRINLRNHIQCGLHESAFITYENLIFNTHIFNDPTLDVSVLVVDFSIFSYHPCNLQNFAFDLEEIFENRENVDGQILEYVEIFTSFFASSIMVNGNCFVQFTETPFLSDVARIEIFDLQPLDFDELEIISENDVLEHDFIFSYDGREYLNMIEMGFRKELSSLRIILDNDTIRNIEAREELESFISLITQLGVKTEILKIYHELKRKTRNDLYFLLNQYWKNNNGFRSLKIYLDPDISKETVEITQAEVIENIIHQYENGLNPNAVVQDIFLTAPTGAGKSLMFQIPAMYIGEKYNALSIVVSPLKALMVNQVESLLGVGYNKVAYINSDITLIERDNIIKNVAEGNIDLIYLAPELLLSYDISFFLNGRRLGLYIVDEAHTVSTWGRDFRIDYWYLGYHINKVRKYTLANDGTNMRFPVIAVTATAPYGNIHDVAFETMSSLKMKSPIKYIGYARRDNIDFEINQTVVQGNYETEKINIAIQRIAQFQTENKKTIVYCPYTTHVDMLNRKGLENDLTVVKYHSGMDNESRKEARSIFRDQGIITMIATKAFGMGVDFKGINCIYHLAPTGLLTDYIQEIGRSARAENTNGIAITDYSSKDFRYINQLNGLGRIQNSQLKEILLKLDKLYEREKQRNHLLDIEDFSYIFPYAHENQLQNEVKKSLLMLEQDLNRKFNRIPVLIARPKNMFSIVYASINVCVYKQFLKTYGSNCATQIPYAPFNGNGRIIIKLDLALLWENNFRKESFARVKTKFFKKELFNNLEVKPKLKISLVINQNKQRTLNLLNEYLNRIGNVLQELAMGFHQRQSFVNLFCMQGFDIQNSERITDLLLPLFSHLERFNNHDITHIDALLANVNFLQSRMNDRTNMMEYRVETTAFGAIARNLRTRVNLRFNNTLQEEIFVSPDSPHKPVYIKLGQFLDIFALGTFQVTGGEKPKMFVRINDPFRIKSQANSPYENLLVADVKSRHHAGVDLMQRFFETEMTTNERWDFIENYLLGNEI